MVRISVFYATSEGKKFDHDYYVNRHMKLVRDRLNSFGLVRTEVDKGLGGLPLETDLGKRGVSARCAVQVVDLKRGDVVHEVRIEGVVEELFDVAVLPGARNPAAVGFLSDEVRHTISLPPDLK